MNGKFLARVPAHRPSPGPVHPTLPHPPNDRGAIDDGRRKRAVGGQSNQGPTGEMMSPKDM